MSESSHSDSDTNGRTTSPVRRDSGKAKPSSSSSGVSKMEFHPALAVSNIKNHIPIILKMEKDQYGMWAQLFRIHARSHRVLHHIVSSTGKTPPAPTDVEHEQWTTLDATVLQWIYSTISTDLLTTILETTPLQWKHGIGWQIFLRTIKLHVLSLLSKSSPTLAWRIFPMSLFTVSVLRCFLTS
ncbi:hypothetical protein A2U01_0031695 [Trifolium medium]|uniref:Polynucleotidyl transferase n=1 Tax=Trifolium medium TaxID=97028 RepID=A0A392PER7_9FABA|nr:hypothetical protein [Trifolium medium]